MNYNLPNQAAEPQLTKAQRIRASLIRQKKQAEQSKSDFIAKWITDEDVTF
jgi:hypothetical protein